MRPARARITCRRNTGLRRSWLADSRACPASSRRSNWGRTGKSWFCSRKTAQSRRLAAFSTSLQQAIGGPAVELHRAVLGITSRRVDSEPSGPFQGSSAQLPADVTINGAGDFAVGGPEGDNGLSGKKLVADVYGPRVPIGGGALSGKDFFKADRGGAIVARRLAKAVVVTGAADACTATLAFFPGECSMRASSACGTELDCSSIRARWARLLDLSLAGAGDRYTGVTDLVDVARGGHFLDPARPWEHSDSTSARPTDVGPTDLCARSKSMSRVVINAVCQRRASRADRPSSRRTW